MTTLNIDILTSIGVLDITLIDTHKTNYWLGKVTCVTFAIKDKRGTDGITRPPQIHSGVTTKYTCSPRNATKIDARSLRLRFLRTVTVSPDASFFKISIDTLICSMITKLKG